MDYCDRCKIKEVKHITSCNGKTEKICCDCHIADGGSPATWHDGCRKYMSKKEKHSEKMLAKGLH